MQIPFFAVYGLMSISLRLSQGGCGSLRRQCAVYASADPDVNPMEREIGGMGIFIVKNIMNQVTYQRLDGKNLLTMKKDI